MGFMVKSLSDNVLGLSSLGFTYSFAVVLQFGKRCKCQCCFRLIWSLDPINDRLPGIKIEYFYSGREETVEPLVSAGAPLRFLVPDNDALPQ